MNRKCCIAGKLYRTVYKYLSVTNGYSTGSFFYSDHMDKKALNKFFLTEFHNDAMFSHHQRHHKFIRRSPTCRDYAENIEARLKSFSMMVDLLFPPPDITPSQVLRDLSQRRCLYAIFVTAENENHRSLTLNILHGTPQGMARSRRYPTEGKGWRVRIFLNPVQFYFVPHVLAAV